MTTVFILLGITLVLGIIGVCIAKLGSNKGKGGVIVLGALIIIAAFITGFFSYEVYNTTPVEYSISNHRENETGYQLTLSSTTKGLTGGTIQISRDEALGLNLIDIDDNWIEDTKLYESREWVNKHRK